MANNNSTSLSVPSTHALDNLPSVDLLSIRRDALLSTPNKYVQAARAAGLVDSAGHLGIQLSTDDVVNHILTIDSVCRAMSPDLDDNNNPVPLTDENGAIVVDENGDIVYRSSIYPIVTFAEAPGYWYNGGKLMAGVLDEWARLSGDDPNSMTYPLLNADLAEIGGIRVFLTWKQGRNRRYVNMVLV